MTETTTLDFYNGITTRQKYYTYEPYLNTVQQRMTAWKEWTVVEWLTKDYRHDGLGVLAW